MLELSRRRAERVASLRNVALVLLRGVAENCLSGRAAGADWEEEAWEEEAAAGADLYVGFHLW